MVKKEVMRPLCHTDVGEIEISLVGTRVMNLWPHEHKPVIHIVDCFLPQDQSFPIQRSFNV